MTPVFLKMSPKRQYFLMAAVRGPDTGDSEDFKFGLTARIRAIVFRPWECLGAFNVDPLAIGELDSIQASLTTVSFHYRNHMYKAVESTVKHRIWGGYGRKLLKVLE